MRNVPLSSDVDVRVIARGCPGFSGADLANLVNEAALTAARKNRRMVTQHDFEAAKDKVMMGAERKSMVMSDAEKRNTAYHEGGHALVALSVPSADPVHKATIIPRGLALGMVMQLPEGDRLSMNYEQMTSRLAIMMGGRVAEELIMGKNMITSGASSDISAATGLARNMVTRWGYSDALGLVSYGDNQEEVFLGHSVARTQNVSEETAKTIDHEVRRSRPGWLRRGAPHPDRADRGPAQRGQGLARVRDPERRGDHQRGQGRPPEPRGVREPPASGAPRLGAPRAAPGGGPGLSQFAPGRLRCSSWAS